MQSPVNQPCLLLQLVQQLSLTVALSVQRVYLWVGVQVCHPLYVHTQGSALAEAVGEVAEGLGS